MFKGLREDAQKNKSAVLYMVAVESGTCDADGSVIRNDYYAASQPHMMLSKTR